MSVVIHMLFGSAFTSSVSGIVSHEPYRRAEQIRSHHITSDQRRQAYSRRYDTQEEEETDMVNYSRISPSALVNRLHA